MKCYFCGRSFKSKQSLYAHLRFCAERKKFHNRWHRFSVGAGEFCIISRSPKTLRQIAAKHERFQSGQIPVEVFVGYLDALNDLKLIEFKYEKEAARALHDAVGVLG